MDIHYEILVAVLYLNMNVQRLLQIKIITIIDTQNVISVCCRGFLLKNLSLF